nr:proto-oncogene serine/threonine-protein kinase mos-like [Penaeus vannamei]
MLLLLPRYGELLLLPRRCGEVLLLPRRCRLHLLQRRCRKLPDCTGVPLIDVDSFLRSEVTKLGEGAYARVYDVSRPGLPPVCMKLYKRQQATDHEDEAERLHALRNVPGLPKLVGLSLAPAAVVMTCHGTRDLHSWLCTRFNMEEYLKMLLSLSTTLLALHTEGFTHNDLKTDNVIIDERNVPTLIDVGLVSRKCARPYKCNSDKDVGELESRRAKRHGHLAPEIFRGGKARPSADVYSFGRILFVASLMTFHEFVPEIAFLMAACKEVEPRKRPTFREIIELLASLIERRAQE